MIERWARRRIQDPSASQMRPCLDCLAGTFSPSRRGSSWPLRGGRFAGPGTGLFWTERVPPAAPVHGGIGWRLSLFWRWWSPGLGGDLAPARVDGFRRPVGGLLGFWTPAWRFWASAAALRRPLTPGRALPGPSRAGRGAGPRGNRSSSMARWIAAVTAACSAWVRSIIGMLSSCAGLSWINAMRRPIYDDATVRAEIRLIAST
jgi:hypothetical protein